MPMLNVRCPKCRAEYTVDASMLGKKARCKKSGCNHTFHLAASEPEPAAPTAEERPRGDDGIPLTWELGDVILDLYEVRPFDEKTAWIEGGMGRVNCVWHRGWNRLLAVKSVRPAMLERRSAVENFQREAEVWVDQLGLHPNVVSCHYVRVLGGLPRLFMDLVPGGSLQDWIDTGKLYEGGPDAALERILDVAIQFAWGLHHAHEQGLIHQDVKPANLLMTSEGIAKVTDFGLAKARAEAGDQGERPAGAALLATWGGMTPAYCSPEQAEIGAQRQHGLPREQSAKLTRGTDIWSWAASVLVMFTGEVVWESGSAAGEFLSQGVEDARVPMPAPVVELLARCFQHRAADRPRDLAKVADALRGIYEQGTGRPYEREQPKPGESLADSLNNRAVSLFDLGKKEEAEAKWQGALRVDPHHPEATYNWGLIRWRSVRMTDQKLLEKLREVRASTADSARVDYLLGLVHLERADAQAAVHLLSKAALAGTGRAEIISALALAQSLGDPSEQLPRTFEGHTHWVTSVSWSPDGRNALSGSDDHTLRLWEVSSGKCLRTFEGHTNPVNSVSWSPDGRHALSGSGVITLAIGDGDNTVRLWEVSSGKCLRTFEGHTDPVNSVSWSPDGRCALSGSDDHTLRLWEVSSGKCLRAFEGHTDKVTSVSWSPDGRCALSGSDDNTLRPWGIAFAKQPVPLVTSMTFAVSSTLYHHLLQQVRDALASNPAAAAGFLQQARQQPGCSRRPDTLELARLLSHSLAHRSFVEGWEKRTFAGHTYAVTSVSWSPDGRCALSGSGDKTLRLWEVASGKCLRIREGHTGGVDTVAWSHDGRCVLSGSWDKTLRLWEVSSGKYLRTFNGHTGWVSSASWSPDGRCALSGSDDKTLRLWEVSSGKCLRTFEGHTARVSSVSWGPDGRCALSGSYDGRLRLWEVSSGKCLRTFEGHTNLVNSVSWSPDGRFALSGSSDDTLRLWEVSGGKCLRTFEGHTDKVNSVSWSPDGRYALSGSNDYTLRLWEVSSGKCLRTFEGHTGDVSSVSWSPDGRCALSGSKDLSARLWELDWEFEPNQPADWDEGARPHLINFLSIQTPLAGTLPTGREPTDEELTLSLTRRGKPACTKEDYRRLLDSLGCAGYGWLRPEGVRRELAKMAAAWTGPPPLG